MKRRQFLSRAATTFAAPALVTRRAFAAEPGAPLPIPPVMEVGPGAGNTLTAMNGTHEFIHGAASETLGYNQDYLGPLLRFQRGLTANIHVINRTDDPITAHWHGMHVPGHLDGGPQLAFDPGKSWTPELPVDHPAATLWYHSHVHGRTANQVYRGLAGMIIIDDPDIVDPLPHDYGTNDFPLIVQDRNFDRSGRMTYDLGMMGIMQGFRGAEVLVNGAIQPLLTVHAGLVRLRLLNASNARMYDFSFTDVGINGKSYDMGRIDLDVPMGETELWRIGADMMMHPFHVHGASFQVVKMNGREVDPKRIGLKDVVHVDGATEILVRFDKRAEKETPFMYHCHILEHEDAGMMGQFTVG